MDNKQIAKAIRDLYAAGRYSILTGDKVEFYIDGLTVRCKDGIDNVRNLADRFETGVPFGGRTQAWPPGRRGTARKCSIVAFNDFWDAGERDNAMEYLRLFPREKWPAKVEAILRAP
jgi:hypothetical protein